MAKQSNSAQKDGALKGKVNKLEKELALARGEGLSVDKLKAETDFENYLKMLKGFAQRYCVIAVVCDTPWGPRFTEELTVAMTGIGFKENLFGKFRCAYAAVIDAGELVYEKLENDRRQYIDEILWVLPSNRVNT